MSYPIDSGVPIPRQSYGGGRPTKYPWPEMGAGDSVLLPLTDADRAMSSGAFSATSSARQWCKANRPDLRVVQRTEHVDGERMVRVWFVERDR